MTAKTGALLIRLTPADKARLQRVADAAYLDASTWARQILLRAVAQAEAERQSSTPPRRTARKR